jgi:ribose transport system permease protein
VGIVLVLLLGVLCGAINGFLSTYGKIPSFIVTLATMSIYRSLAFLILGTPIFGLGCPGAIFYGRFWDSLPFYYVVVLCPGLLFLRNTGRAIYAVGGNESAARLTGLAVTEARWWPS